MIDFFKYILFDESKNNGFKGMVVAIIKLFILLICMSPVFIYFYLYQPNLLDDFSFTYIVIFSLSCIWFFVVFLCSKPYATILLFIFIAPKLIKKDIKANEEKQEKEANEEKKEKEDKQKENEFYFNASLAITSIFQFILSIVLLITYDHNNLFNTIIEELLYIASIEPLYGIIKIFIVFSFIIWIILYFFFKPSKSKDTNQILDKSEEK